jgi:hypothetical protein
MVVLWCFLIFIFTGFLAGAYLQESLHREEMEQIKVKNYALREEVGRLMGMIPAEKKKGN